MDQFTKNSDRVTDPLRQQQFAREEPAKSMKKTITTTTTTTTTRLIKDQKDYDGDNVAVVVEDLGRQAPAAETFSGGGGKLTSRVVYDTSRNPNNLRHPRQVQESSQSGSERVTGMASTPKDRITTIGTVAVESGESRIVLALLKDGPSLRLKVQEMRPAIFELGLNFAECLKYVEENERLLRKLKKHERAPIDAWMQKFQEIQRTKERNMTHQRHLIYSCMADNLADCWQALRGQVERRSSLLAEASSFYGLVEELNKQLDRIESQLQNFRRQFLDDLGAHYTNGPTGSIDVHLSELQRLNRKVLATYNEALKKQKQLIELVISIAESNLGDARENYLMSDGQNLINYIRTYLDPLERKRLYLESTITKVTTTVIDEQKKKLREMSRARQTRVAQQDNSHNNKIESENNSHQNTYSSTKVLIREISSFNDLNLVENWLKTKIDQLNASSLSSLGVNVSDSRNILSKHEQIALECRAIEEATLTFNGRNIHAIKNFDEDSSNQQGGEKSLFGPQKLLAQKARDVLTILESRIILLRRTIDFYVRSKESTSDIAVMLRRLQVDNSLQSVQFVQNELELKDVSSVVASGATIISELQQLQLAQQHGQRSRLVNLNLMTNGIRAIIDQLNHDLAHLKTVLNQRRLILINEDTTKMAKNFSNKCHQLHFWLNQHIKRSLIENQQIGPEVTKVRVFCDAHERLRLALQNKTLEVEALFRSFSTSSESFATNRELATELQRDMDSLRNEWIKTTNCLDARLELARRYLSLLNMEHNLEKEFEILEKYNDGQQVTGERTGEDIKSGIDQTLIQLENHVKNFIIDAKKKPTELEYQATDNKSSGLMRSEINKSQLIDQANGMLDVFATRRNQVDVQEASRSRKRLASNMDQGDRKTHPQDKSEQQVRPKRSMKKPQQHQYSQSTQHNIEDKPLFTRLPMVDQLIEPFSQVELECETSSDDCQVEWFVNNFKKIPANVRHSIKSEGNKHKLIIDDFKPASCGLYQVRASKGTRQEVGEFRLRLKGVDEVASGDDDASRALSRQGTSPEVAKTKTVTTTTTSTTTVETTSTKGTRPSNQPEVVISDETNVQATSGPETTTGNISRIIQGVETPSKSPASLQGARSGQKQQNSGASTRALQLGHSEETLTQRTGSEATGSPQFSVTQASYSIVDGGRQSATGSLEPRISFIDSASISRSASRSPMVGTPQAPAFLEDLKQDSGSVGSRCSPGRSALVCLVVGNPPPTIEWLHNNQLVATAKCPARPPLEGSANLTTPASKPRGNICKLTIETADDKTQGIYECRAKNRAGHASTSLTLAK